jgi:hypothetical protein
MDLRALSLHLNFEGLEAELMSSDAGEYIDVKVLVDGFAERVTVQLAPVEPVGSGIGDLEMLQFFAAIPRELSGAEAEIVTKRLVAVNAHLSLGAFSLIGDPAVVYLRHVMLLPPTATAKQMVAEGVWLVHYGLDLHVGTLLDF